VLQSARFRNFKALRELSIDLERFTVLVGANGCGKTSVLEAIDLVCRMRTPIPDESSFSYRRATHVFSGASAPHRLQTSGTNDHLVLEVTTSTPFWMDFHFSSENPQLFTLRMGTIAGNIELGGSQAPHSGQITTFLQKLDAILPRTLRLRLNPESLSKSSAIEPGTRPSLASDGEGLPSMLAYLAGRRTGAVERIESDLRRIVDRVETIRVEPEKVVRDEVEYIKLNDEAIPRHTSRSYAGNRLELSMRGAGFLRAEAISEGTLLALGMLTVLHADDAPSLVLFDDIDRGLHPTAQRAVFACLRQLLDTRPELQIVCTTHSPYALDCVRPEEVRVLKLDQAGHTHVRKLTDHPEWPQWKDHLAPGEFWSAHGEDWVYGDADAG
jgi:energy-coupling factor transporter ATP-binding protein EcfA2